MKKYVTLTTMSQFRLKYVVPFEKLQELNPSHELTDEDAVIWAQECIMSEEIEEVGQNWLNEFVVEASITDEQGAAATFIRENTELVEQTNMDHEDITKRIDELFKAKSKEGKKDITL